MTRLRRGQRDGDEGGPVVDALESLVPEGSERPHRVLLTPQGQPFSHETAVRFSQRNALALVCGRYEGVDERVREHVDEEVSIGDFVLLGGEVAAMAIIEAVARLIPRVLGNAESAVDESHVAGLLEYPHYTRPPTYRERSVPDVLLSGAHAAIDRWRRTQALVRTRERRARLVRALRTLARRRTAASGRRRGRFVMTGEPTSGLSIALVHHPVRSRDGSEMTTAITNLDVHDLARWARTYGADAYYLVTPITIQQELVERIVSHWREAAATSGSPSAEMPSRAS